ncbi:uncharacterized protein [Parasteatoda tepidariorum]|uniref:uncharacterized protein n=1 Tax=Parasteatoda tepidariorum TaxID=114398 RepID=UPI00077F8545|nr:uncharacterized protein LOC107456707 [Parasteatoda tepidariorum]
MIIILTVTVLLEIKLFIVTVIALTASQKCTLVELNGCLESLMSVTKSNDFTFAATRDQLKTVCSSLKESVQCVDEHMNLCFTPTQRKVFNHVVSGARQVLTDLCVPGTIQEAYLAHASCFINITLDEEKCAPKYRHLIKMSENVNEKQNVDEGLKGSCCAFREFILCKYVYVERDCGPDANVFLQQHLDRITSPLLHEHCAHYTYGTGTCNSSSSDLNFTIFPPMILTLSLSIAVMNFLFFPTLILHL